MPRSLSNTFHDVQRPLLGDGLLDVEDGGDDVGVESVHVRRQPGAVGVAPARSHVTLVTAGHSWSQLVTAGHRWSLVVTAGGPDAVGGGVLQLHPGPLLCQRL